MTHLHVYLDATQVSVRLAPEQDSFDSSIGQIGIASQVLRFRVQSQLSSLDASLFWRSLAVSTASSLHEAINLRPPSVTVSFHSAASNAVDSQSPAMPNPGCRSVRNRCTLFLPNPSSTYSTLKVPEHDSLFERLRVAPESIEVSTANILLNRPCFCT